MNLFKNISCESAEPWRPLGRVLMLYILPIICIVGLALNVACLIVFRQRRSHPFVPALILLSICDSLQLLFSIFVLYIPALHDHLEMQAQGIVAQISYLATGTLAGGLLASNCASIWTMCYISFQRHQAIVQPFATVNASKSYCRNLTLVGIGIFAIFFNIPVWFEFSWHISESRNKSDEMGSKIIWHSTSSLSCNEDYRFIMRKIIYPIAVYLIPLVVITVLNLRILFFINISNRVQTADFKRRMAKERRSIKLLGSIVLLFFLCHTGGLIIRLVDFGQFENAPCFVFATDFVNFMFNINSFANPMLYFFFTKQFKDLRTTWSSASSSNNTFRKKEEIVCRLIQKSSLRSEK